MNNTAPDTRSPKFKHTRELVRIALDDGMTQEEIARQCRTTQSVVSTWANGKAKARKEVLEPLLRRYAHRLNRTTSRVYLVQRTPSPAWEDTEEGRLAARLQSEPELFTREHLDADSLRAWAAGDVRRKLTAEYSDGGPLEGQRDENGEYPERAFEPITEAEINAALGRMRWSQSPAVAAAWRRLARGAPPKASYSTDEIVSALRDEYAGSFVSVVRVEGPTLWRHSLGTPAAIRVREGRTGERVDLTLVPHQRWIVHSVGPGVFRLLVQTVRNVSGWDSVIWERAVRKPLHHDGYDARYGRVLADDDSARWITTLHEPVDLPGLIALVDGLLKTAGPQDRAVVPFTLRKSLVEHGYDVPDVEFIASL